MAQLTIDAILFDKDGTLFDFQASWGDFTLGFLNELAEGDDLLFQVLADAAGFDARTGRLPRHSPIVAGTTEDVAEVLLPHLPQAVSLGALADRINAAAEQVTMAPAVPLAPFLDGLIARGLVLGVATNDAEASARAHLDRAAVLDRFAFVAGYDSGFGGKPAPGQLLAFAEAAGVAPARVAMVGDSTHDLLAGRAAGMATVGVLTGPAGAPDLAPLADVVLPDIGALPGWLDGRGG